MKPNIRQHRPASSLLAILAFAATLAVPATAEAEGPSIGTVYQGEALTAWTQVTALPPDTGLTQYTPPVLHEGSSSVVRIQDLDLSRIPQSWLDLNGGMVNVAVRSAVVPPPPAEHPADSDVKTLMNEAVFTAHYATFPLMSTVVELVPIELVDGAVDKDRTGTLAELKEAAVGMTCYEWWEETGREIPDDVPIGEVHHDLYTRFEFTATNVSESRFDVGYTGASESGWKVKGSGSVGNTATVEGSFSREKGENRNHEIDISVEYVKEVGYILCAWGLWEHEYEGGEHVRPVKHRANPRVGTYRSDRIGFVRACEKGYMDPIDRTAKIVTTHQKSHTYAGSFTAFGVTLGSHVTYSAGTRLELQVQGVAGKTDYSGNPISYYQFGDTAAIVNGPKVIHETYSYTFDFDSCSFT